MDKVQVTAKIENRADLFSRDRGRILETQVRSILVDAAIDGDVIGLSLPTRLLEALGFIESRLSHGAIAAVRLTVQGRDCIAEVTETSDEFPATIGHTCLTLMDWVVDQRGHRLIGNPDHNGEFIYDAL